MGEIICFLAKYLQKKGENQAGLSSRFPPIFTSKLCQEKGVLNRKFLKKILKLSVGIPSAPLIEGSKDPFLTGSSIRLIGYNALCHLLKEASLHSSTPREQLSFKGALQVMRAWEHRFRDWRVSLGGLLRSLYENLAEALLVKRPNRVEPRANKRRPKIIRLMTKPRRVLHKELLQKFSGTGPLVCPLS